MSGASLSGLASRGNWNADAGTGRWLMDFSTIVTLTLLPSGPKNVCSTGKPGPLLPVSPRTL